MAMCKEVGACPVPAGENVDCNCFGCSGFDKGAYASANDGIMTWPELLDKMGSLGDKWEDAIKGWVKDVDCNCFGCSGFDKDAYAS